jgi:hypothetical protein
MSKHEEKEPPATGAYDKAGKSHHGLPPHKAQVAQRNESGTILWKATSMLWGWRSGKKS